MQRTTHTKLMTIITTCYQQVMEVECFEVRIKMGFTLSMQPW